MTLSNSQYHDIMRQYEDIRLKNYRISSEREDEADRLIPELAKIREEMASLTASRVRSLLYEEKDGEGKSVPDPAIQKIRKISDQKKALLIRHGYPPDWLDPVYDCPDCRDTGYIGHDKCHCFIDKIRDLLYDQSNLKAILDRENFNNFRTDYYPDHLPGEESSPRENIEQILRASFEFIRSFDQDPPPRRNNLLIYGSAGTGKSFLSHCIADALLKQGHSALYLSSYRLFEILADSTFGREKPGPAHSSLIFSCDLLIIDDLGTEMTNSFVNSSLFTCLNERLQARRATIINTNLSLEQINKTYSERIFSRLMEAYIPLHILGDDIRLKMALSSLDESGESML